MIEQLIPISIAIVSGCAMSFNRVHNRINVLDKRLDAVELRMADCYVSKNDFQLTIQRIEGHMERIEYKLDKVLTSS